MSVLNKPKDQLYKENYDHEAWVFKRRVLRYLLKTVAFGLLIKIDRVTGRENVPQDGPVVFFMNHIAFVDPLVVLYVCRRDIVPMAKIEVYDYPVIGIFPKLWGVIPVRRGQVDRRAIRQALRVLEAGECVLVAPEGTRGDALRPGKEGAAYLAKNQRHDCPRGYRRDTGISGFSCFRALEETRCANSFWAPVSF